MVAVTRPVSSEGGDALVQMRHEERERVLCEQGEGAFDDVAIGVMTNDCADVPRHFGSNPNPRVEDGANHIQIAVRVVLHE